MLVTRLYIGLNDKNTKKQLFSDHIIDSQIRTIIRDYGIDSFTMQNATGVYTHDNGLTVLENTRIITIMDMGDFRLFELVDNLKIILNQECIMVEQYKCDVKFM